MLRHPSVAELCGAAEVLAVLYVGAVADAVGDGLAVHPALLVKFLEVLGGQCIERFSPKTITIYLFAHMPA